MDATWRAVWFECVTMQVKGWFMSRIRSFVCLSAVCALLTSTALAQDSYNRRETKRQAVRGPSVPRPPRIQDTVFQDTVFQDTAFQDDVDVEASPGDDDVAYTSCGACEPTCECEPSCGCDNGCSKCCCDPCDYGDPWKLIPDHCAISAGGWIQSGFASNAHGDPSNGSLGFNNANNGWQLHQLWGYLEKSADTGHCGVDWGFRCDYVFGVDGADTQAFGDQGWDFGWNSSVDYGSAIPQLYVELAYNDFTFRYGHFYTTIGWEVVQAPDNFFYTHAYTQYYGEPFTHTGFLGTWEPNDCWTYYFGYVDGWDSGWENRGEAATFLGGVSYAMNDCTTFTWAVVVGDFGNGRPLIGGNASNGDIYMNSFVMQRQISDKLTYVFQHDFGTNTGLGAGDNEWYGINQYLQYEINGCWSVGTRYEWFRDDDGARVIGAAGHFHEISLGVNYRPHANLVVRPELRWDWFDADAAGGPLPFDRGTRSSQFLGACDVIFTF